MWENAAQMQIVSINWWSTDVSDDILKQQNTIYIANPKSLYQNEPIRI